MCRLTKWSQTVRAIGYWAVVKPTADSVMVLELCVSDENKPLLLASPDFIPYLVDALLLDPDHPRADMTQELNAPMPSNPPLKIRAQFCNIWGTHKMSCEM